MDGKALQIDDKVYDLLYGNGEVLSVSNGGAVVKFQRMSQSYDADEALYIFTRGSNKCGCCSK